MTGGLPVKPTPLAALQIRKESRWWRRHRTKAPNLFREELLWAFELISTHPEVGAVAEDSDLQSVRRVLLAGTHHYLYYRLDEARQIIEVLALWGTSRLEGTGL
ncbi:MAG TPA: type II toxin-antitoxin system RelE/ParE family toxin [Thermoanaerobaculia bacterium]|nr:type II toxin-antitoxin system RelE/ParE family toxin [Thermoanaerobaculia bacterium]